ncbi:MAG: bifunctional pyr operon transcriptional regulator/uracil phosphoribosyltransferase PyrR [Thermodesulfobacteriota bacterium]
MSKKYSGNSEIDEFISKSFDYLNSINLENLIIIGIKTRGEFLGKRLVKLIKNKKGKNVPFGTLDITLYRDDFKNKKEWPQLKKTEIPLNIEGKDILLIDDVIYTGRTARAAINSLMDYGRPSSVKLAVFVDRGNRELPIQPDVVGIRIETTKDELVNVFINEVDKKEEVEVIESDGVQ